MNEKEFVFWALGFTSTLTKEEVDNKALSIIMSKLSEIKTTITTDGVKAADSYASIYKEYTELGRCRDNDNETFWHNESELNTILKDKEKKASELQAAVLEYNKQDQAQVAIVRSLDNSKFATDEFDYDNSIVSDILESKSKHDNEQLKSMELQTGMEALEATGGWYSTSSSTKTNNDN
tara:strand:- start:77 stop:613 length:537 start_codon:yes stop_codon:yes gene_type:complete